LFEMAFVLKNNLIMQLFKYLPSALLTCLVLAYAPAISQQTEEKEEARETEIIIITETIDENGNKNVNKTIHKGNFTNEEISRITGEPVDDMQAGDEYEVKVIVEDDELHEGDDLHEAHNRGYLGVNIEDAAGQGARVTGVIKDSPAESVGIVKGDVIKAVNGKAVSSTEELIKAVGSRSVGDQIEVTYAREGAPTTVKVTLAERPKAEMDDVADPVEIEWIKLPESSPKPRLGVYIETVDNGVGITEVTEGSLAESAGLKTGDIITSFNGTAVSSPKELVDEVQNSPAGEDVAVEFMRDGEKMTKTLTFEKK
jgi:S1-C subfamily serine protease